MKNLLFLFGALLFCLLLTQVEYSSAHPFTASEKKVVNQEYAYFQALKDQNQELMSSLLHENFIISGIDRPTYPDLNKEEFLATMPGQVITWQEIEHIKVDINGNVARSVVDISMVKSYNGKDHTGDYQVFSVWVKEDGDWQLLNRRIKLLGQS